MLHTSIKLYLMGYAKGIISASYCITNVFLETKIAYRRVNYVHLNSSHLSWHRGAEIWKSEKVSWSDEQRLRYWVSHLILALSSYIALNSTNSYSMGL